MWWGKAPFPSKELEECPSPLLTPRAKQDAGMSLRCGQQEGLCRNLEYGGITQSGVGSSCSGSDQAIKSQWLRLFASAGTARIQWQPCCGSVPSRGSRHELLYILYFQHLIQTHFLSLVFQPFCGLCKPPHTLPLESFSASCLVDPESVFVMQSRPQFKRSCYQ